MNNIERFQAYADAFEETYDDNNWERIQQHFTADAVYAPGDGTEAVGREAVLARLGENINGLDRQFDSRVLASQPPTSDGDTVTLTWRLTLSKAGAPDLHLSGVEHATYADDAISRLEDVFDEGTGEALGSWMEAHQGLLAP